MLKFLDDEFTIGGTFNLPEDLFMLSLKLSYENVKFCILYILNFFRLLSPSSSEFSTESSQTSSKLLFSDLSIDLLLFYGLLVKEIVLFICNSRSHFSLIWRSSDFSFS